MGSTVRTNKKYRQGLEITEIVVDDEVYKVTEEYKDDNGDVVYIYEYYPNNFKKRGTRKLQRL